MRWSNRVTLTSVEILAKSSCSSYVLSNSLSTVQGSANSIRYRARKVSILDENDERWPLERSSLERGRIFSRRGKTTRFRLRIATGRLAPFYPSQFIAAERSRRNFGTPLVELEPCVLDLIPRTIPRTLPLEKPRPVPAAPRGTDILISTPSSAVYCKTFSFTSSAPIPPSPAWSRFRVVERDITCENK